MLRKCPLDPIAANWMLKIRGVSCLVTGRREIGMLYRTISVCMLSTCYFIPTFQCSCVIYNGTVVLDIGSINLASGFDELFRPYRPFTSVGSNGFQ
jgi:hypothetical protein